MKKTACSIIALTLLALCPSSAALGCMETKNQDAKLSIYPWKNFESALFRTADLVYLRPEKQDMADLMGGGGVDRDYRAVELFRFGLTALPSPGRTFMVHEKSCKKDGITPGLQLLFLDQSYRGPLMVWGFLVLFPIFMFDPKIYALIGLGYFINRYYALSFARIIFWSGFMILLPISLISLELYIIYAALFYLLYKILNFLTQLLPCNK